MGKGKPWVGLFNYFGGILNGWAIKQSLLKDRGEHLLLFRSPGLKILAEERYKLPVSIPHCIWVAVCCKTGNKSETQVAKEQGRYSS